MTTAYLLIKIVLSIVEETVVVVAKQLNEYTDLNG